MHLIFEILNSYSFWQWFLACAAVATATSIQFGIGIAFGVVAAPLLALISIDFVPVCVLFLTFMTATTGAIREWRLINWYEIRWSVSGRALGGIIASYVMILLSDERMFILFFGLVIGAIVLLSIAGLKIPFTYPALCGAGMVSGFTATITGVGGPPMAIVYQHHKAADARPTLQAYFTLGSAASILILYFSGLIVFRDAIITVLLLPGFFIGYLAAPFIRPFVDKNFRMLLLAVAGISAVLLIFKGLL